MINTELKLLPSCSQCGVIKGEGIWHNIAGEILKTTKKLDLCGRCHIAQYCTKECQVKHWPAHKSKCAAIPGLRDSEFQTLIDKNCKGPGRYIFHIGSNNAVTSFTKFPEKTEKVLIEIDRENSVLAERTYTLGSRIQPSSTKEIEKIKAEQFEILKRATILVEEKRYLKAFSLIAKESLPAYAVSFFYANVQTMLNDGADFETIVQCAKLLGLERAKVHTTLYPPKNQKLPEPLQNKINIAIQLHENEREDCIVKLAQEVADLHFYEDAFDLVARWVSEESKRIIFFKAIHPKMIDAGLTYEYIRSLGKKIEILETQIELGLKILPTTISKTK